ncbi:unnamed protein product [Sphagnum jensenii]|uniref:Uncharacterized protein n=1 Tax=Sphagnum jensenii TaxID=128206 RepID=A0ABP1A5G9_9BRYO
MVCDSVLLTLALSGLCVTGYKDNVDNGKELFKFAIIDEATRSFQPLELDMTPNVLPDDNNDIDVQVCDHEDTFGMVNVNFPSQDIKNGMNATLDTTTLDDLANEAFKEWILLKVD